MKVVIAPDSFKESLEAQQVAEALADGLRRALPDAVLDLVPVADGGEGTVACLVAATGGALEEAEVTGPLGEPVMARYGLLGDGRTAVIEMSAASGLPLVPPGRRDPLVTTTRGTGELMARAVERHGCRRLLIGIGGSATCDGGAGAAQALGARLLDAGGVDLEPGGGALERLERIDVSGWRLSGVEVVVACDVDNPLCGERGAAAVYGPQKGATPAAVARLDAGLRRLAEVVRRDLGRDVLGVPGAGAAGGLGAGLLAFCDATLRPGVDLVLDAVGLEERLADADLVVTGEGRLDAQTLHNKAPQGVCRCAGRLGVPVVAVAGSVADERDALHEAGFDAVLGIVPGPCTLADAMRDAPSLLRQAGEELGRLLRLGGRWT